MTDLNRTMLIGRLTQNPETKEINSGQSVTTFSVATNKTWVEKSGNKKEQVEFHNIEVWGKLAEVCSKYLTKGKQVFLSGRLKTNSWEAEGVKKYKTSVVLEDMQMLGSMAEANTGTREDYSQPSPTPATTQPIQFDEETIDISEA